MYDVSSYENRRIMHVTVKTLRMCTHNYSPNPQKRYICDQNYALHAERLRTRNELSKPPSFVFRASIDTLTAFDSMKARPSIGRMAVSRDFSSRTQNVLYKVTSIVYSRKRMNTTSLLRTTQTALSIHRNLNCWTAAITKKHRKLYLNTYRTCLVLPDGSSISIDYDEPRRIITLPLNIETLSEEQRRIRLEGRRTIKKAKIVEEVQDDFDETQFYKMVQ